MNKSENTNSFVIDEQTLTRLIKSGWDIAKTKFRIKDEDYDLALLFFINGYRQGISDISQITSSLAEADELLNSNERKSK